MTILAFYWNSQSLKQSVLFTSKTPNTVCFMLVIYHVYRVIWLPGPLSQWKLWVKTNENSSLCFWLADNTADSQSEARLKIPHQPTSI